MIGELWYVFWQMSSTTTCSALVGHVHYGFGIRRKAPQGIAHQLCVVSLVHFPTVRNTHIVSFSSQPPSPFKEPLSFIAFLWTPWTEKEKEGLERTKWFQTRGRGYSAEQGTQPQTLGYSLADSPVGLLAWIYEKLYNWTDSYPWEDDESEC